LKWSRISRREGIPVEIRFKRLEEKNISVKGKFKNELVVRWAITRVHSLLSASFLRRFKPITAPE
jgi:hypothetical protein